MTETHICETFLLIAERCAREHGAPLPQKLLFVGDPDHGWYVKLSPTKDIFGGVRAFSADVYWNGFPAGIIDAAGGVIAAGTVANEESLRAWLTSDMDGT